VCVCGGGGGLLDRGYVTFCQIPFTCEGLTEKAALDTGHVRTLAAKE